MIDFYLVLGLVVQSSFASTLYTWGSAASGQSCRPVSDGGTSVQPAPVPSIVNPVRVYAGVSHTFVLTSTPLGQNLYACGNNTAGVLGIRSTVDTPVYEPAIVPLPLTSAVVLVQLVTGTHTAVLLSDGRVMLWGDNSHGQLCSGSLLPPHTPDATAPVVLTRDTFGGCAECHVVSIAAGWRHTVIVTAEPAIYTCGANDQGQLGAGLSPEGLRESPSPRVLRPLMPFGIRPFRYTSAVAGSFHSLVLAVASDGETAVVGFGDNRFSQITTAGGAGAVVTTPVVIHATKAGGVLRGGVTAITASGYTSVFITAAGAYAVGGNFRGLGGVGSTTLAQMKHPTLMDGKAWVVPDSGRGGGGGSAGAWRVTTARRSAGVASDEEGGAGRGVKETGRRNTLRVNATSSGGNGSGGGGGVGGTATTSLDSMSTLTISSAAMVANTRAGRNAARSVARDVVRDGARGGVRDVAWDVVRDGVRGATSEPVGAFDTAAASRVVTTLRESGGKGAWWEGAGSRSYHFGHEVSDGGSEQEVGGAERSQHTHRRARVTADGAGAADVRLSVPLGHAHGILHSVSGVWTWGSDEYGQLGRGAVGGSAEEPQLCLLLPPQRAVSVAAGYSHSAAILSDQPAVRAPPDSGPPLPLRVVALEVIDLPPPVVYVTFTVLDRDGAPVSGLTEQQIVVRDAGTAVTAAAHKSAFRQVTPAEVGVKRVTVVAVDVSDAVRLREASLDAVVATLVPLAQTAGPLHQVGLIAFDASSSVYTVSDGLSDDAVALGQAAVSIRAVLGSDGSRPNAAAAVLHGLVAVREGMAAAGGLVTRGLLVVMTSTIAGATPEEVSLIRSALSGASVEVVCVGVGVGPFEILEEVCMKFVALDIHNVTMLRDMYTAAAAETAALGNGTYVMSYCSPHSAAVSVPVDVEVSQGDGRKAVGSGVYVARRVPGEARDTCRARPPITKSGVCDGQCGVKAAFWCGQCGLAPFQRSTFVVEDGSYVYFYVHATEPGLYTVQARSHLSRQYLMLAMRFGREPTSLVSDAVFPNPLTEVPALRVGWQAGNASDMYFVIAPCNANGRWCEGQDTSSFPYLVDVSVIFEGIPPTAPVVDQLPSVLDAVADVPTVEDEESAFSLPAVAMIFVAVLALVVSLVGVAFGVMRARRPKE